MNIVETPLKDLYIIEPKVIEDSRGYFFEAYNRAQFKKYGIGIEFVQDNQSKSGYGVVRGLHFQKEPKSQSKLVRVLEGSVFDVAVDCRKGSPTFGKWYGLELSSDNKKQLLIPKGFAHGFSVLSQNAIVFYKCDEFYSSEHDSGIFYKDSSLNINWQIPDKDIVISDKDTKQPSFKDAELNF
jgi:dTDP-4-dehydrorhamnose 3,5-epimerase